MIYITGIAGFIGSSLANELHKRGYNVSGCDNLQFGFADNLHPGIEWQRQDISTINFIPEVDTLVHCATANIIFAQDNHIDTFRTNALESIYMIKRFKGKIIYTSTASVYGNAQKLPTTEETKTVVSNAYDQSKLITELYLRLRGNYTTLRLSNVYGANQRPENPYAGVVAKFIDSIMNGKPVQIIGDGLATRDFTYVEDTIEAIIKAIDLPAQEMEINISSGVETSVINVAHKLHEIFDQPFYATFKGERQIDGIDRRWLCIDKAKQLLNWEPKFSLEAGLRNTILYYVPI